MNGQDRQLVLDALHELMDALSEIRDGVHKVEIAASQVFRQVDGAAVTDE